MASLEVATDLLNGAGDLATTGTYAHTVATRVARRQGDVAYAMQDLLDVGRLRTLVAIASVPWAGTACNVDLGLDFSHVFPDACADYSQPPPNSTTTTDSNGCTLWRCEEGYQACGGGGDCSTNLLGDAANCGACGHDCGGSKCFEGSCTAVTVLASGLAELGEVAVDSTRVYVVSGDSEGILHAPKTGGNATIAVAWGSGIGTYGVAIAVDSSGLYWAYRGGLGVRPATIDSVFGFDGPIGQDSDPILLDDSYVYGMGALEDFEPDASLMTYAVWRAPKSRGPTQVLFQLSQGWSYDGWDPIALVAGKLAYADGESIVAASSDGTSRRVVATQATGVGALTADSVAIYWSPGSSLDAQAPECVVGDASYCMTYPSFDAGAADGIFGVNWGGGAVRTISSRGGLVDIRAAGGAIWGILRGAQGLPDQLVRVDMATGLHTIVAGGGPIGGIAVDATSVYFSRGSKLLSTPL